MRYRSLSDPFINDQPRQGFLEELVKPYHSERPHGFGERCAEVGELELKEISS